MPANSVQESGTLAVVAQVVKPPSCNRFPEELFVSPLMTVALTRQLLPNGQLKAKKSDWFPVPEITKLSFPAVAPPEYESEEHWISTVSANAFSSTCPSNGRRMLVTITALPVLLA